MKRKVLMIVKGFEKTGVSSVILSYIDNINTDFFSIDVLTGNSYAADYKKYIKEKGCKFFEIADRDRNIIKYVLIIADIVKREKYDIVHVHGNSSMIFPELFGAWLGGCKVRVAHSHNTTCNHIRLNKVCRPIFNCLNTLRLACGEAAGEWMFAKKSFTVIPNGINEKKYEFSTAVRKLKRMELGISDSEILLGHVGCFNYQKNQEYLVSLIESINKKDDRVKLLLVGDGETYSLLKKDIEERKLEKNIILYGLSNDVPGLMMAMDEFLLPSRFEGLPCVLVEAQASGLPCIVSDKVSDEARMSPNYCSLPISVDSTEMWISQIYRYSRYDREVMAQINLATIRAKGYNIAECVSLLEKTYFEALG